MAKKEQSDREIAELLAELREKTESPAPSAPETASKKAKNMTDDDVKALLRRYYTDVDTLPQEKAPSFEFDTSDFEPDEPLETEKKVEKPTEKPKKPRAERKKPPTTPIAATEPETVEEPVAEPEPEIVEEPVAEPEPEIVEEPVAEPEPEIAVEPVAEPEPEIAEAPLAEPEPEIAVEPVAEPEPEIIEATDAEEYEDEVLEDTIEPGAVLTEESVPDDDAPLRLEDIDEEGIVDEILYDLTDLAPDTTEQHFVLEEYELPPEAENTDEPEAVIAEETVLPAEPEPETVEEPEPAESVGEISDYPVLPDEEDIREWHPTHDVSGRSDDGELDLMVALGFGDKLVDKYGDERVRRAEEKLRLREEREELEINAHGYAGAELTPRTDRSKVKARYVSAQKRLTVKLTGSIILAAVLFFFENLRFFGIYLGGPFEITSFRTLIPMLLLIGIAAISYHRLIEAVLFSIGRRRRGNVIMPITLLITVGYDLVIIFAFPQSAVALFNFPVALGFIFELLSELFDIIREQRIFDLLCADDAGKLYGLTPLGNDDRDRNLFSADRIAFVEGYFRRSSDNRRSYPMQMLLTVLPLAAGGALLAIISSVVGLEPVRAIGSFPAVFAFAAPLAVVFNRSWQQLRAALSLADRKSGVIGGVATDEYRAAECVVFDDHLAFPSDGVEIKNIKLYENCDIYNTIYNVNALFQKAGGPLRELMQFTAANLGHPKSAVMTAAGDHYVEALIDGSNKVCAGSYTALTSRGIAVERNPDDSRDSEDACVMYAAINGEACARFCVRYNLSESFLKKAKLLAAEGIGIRLRTLDPNLDRAMLVTKFGERIDAGVRREPPRTVNDEPAGTSVIARGESLGLAEPLAVARRLERAERKLAVVSSLHLMAGAVAATLVIFFAVPSYMLSALASVMQLLGVIPAAIIYSLNVKYKDTK